MAPTNNILAQRAPKTALANMPIIRPDRHVFARSDISENAINIVLLVLGFTFFTLIIASAAFLFRRRRQNQQRRRRAETLPAYSKGSSLSIDEKVDNRASVVYIGRDGQPMLQNPGAPPQSPENVPEIHITFPDEQDESGRQQSGRVLIVRVGDNATIGLEPMDEQLPAYEKESKTQFKTIDMDSIGGLKEKERTVYN